MKTIIERGASWTLEETKLLLVLWGQDLIARQATCQKRTKEVYEKISEKFNQGGFERTPDQVRTRVFNMIAEYRRILKNPSPERMQKCIFFETLHKIYQARHMSDVKSAIDDYEPGNPYSPTNKSQLSELLDEAISDSEALLDGNDEPNSTSDTTNSNNTVTNNNSAASKSVVNNDSSSTNATPNNGNNVSSHNSKTSATTENIANSVNDNHAKKNPAGKDNQLAVKRIKIESPKAGTSQGDSMNSDCTTPGDGKQGKTVPNNVAGGSSASNTHHASLLSSSNAQSAGGTKQQSLLAATSTTSTPITKLTPGSSSASYINLNSTKLPIIRSQFLGHSNGNESININGTTPTTTRLPTTAAITSHQLYQAPVNTFDVTSSALLIDRMFAHLSRESENMREWIALEKERIALERARRAQETEREIRRERVLIDTLMKFHEQWISFVARLDPRIMEGAAGQLPELKIPKETESQQQGPSISQTNQGDLSNTPNSQNSGINSGSTTTAQPAPLTSGSTSSTTLTTTSRPTDIESGINLNIFIPESK